MFELHHYRPVDTLPRGDFCPSSLEKKATLKFKRCPKFVTLATHVNQADLSPVRCYWGEAMEEIIFSVPKQSFDVRITQNSIRYVLVRVFDDQMHPALLVVREMDRKGFLVPIHNA